MRNILNKIIMGSVIAACSISTISFANQTVKANVKARFVPNSWTSANSKDVISIKTPSSNGSSYYGVQIHVADVNLSFDDSKPAGIVVKNCSGVGSVDTVNPGSVIICSLNQENPVLTFSSNSDKFSAHGESQVE